MGMNDKFILKATAELNSLLEAEEKSLCPTYCVFKSTGFLSSGSVLMGFITITDKGRILTVKTGGFGGYESAAYSLSSITDFKLKNFAFGQKILKLTVFDAAKAKNIKLSLQISPKLVGTNLPDQADNLEHLIILLSRQGQ